MSLTSFSMDVSSEMVINILPLFLSNMLRIKTNSMRVDDLALFKGAYAALGEQGKVGEVAVSFHAGVVAAGGWQPVVAGG